MDLALAEAAVASTAPSVDHLLPVDDLWVPLLPDGLARGRTISCGGLAAPSLGLSLLAGALTEGAWLAIIDLVWLGIEAAHELGAPPERIVRVDTAGGSDGGTDETGELWAEALAAAIDGFDCLLTRVPSKVPARLVDRLGTRLRRRGGVLVALGDPGPLSPDLTITATDPRWQGLGDGHGHLRKRHLDVTVSGRRVPRPRRAGLQLPDAGSTGAETAGPSEPPSVETGPATALAEQPSASRSAPARSPLRPVG